MISFIPGSESEQTRSSNDSSIMSNFNVLGRWSPHVVPMERAKRVHGHVMGLWQVHGHNVRPR